MKKEQRIVILLLLLAVTVILLFAANALIPQQKHGSTNHKKLPTNTPVPVIEQEEEKSQEKSMIVSVDTKEKKIVCRNLETGEEYALSYDTKTDITDKYGKVLVAGSLKFGDIVDVTLDLETQKFESICKSSDHWELRNVENFGLSVEESRFTISGTNYKLTDGTVVIQDGNIVPLGSLHERDVLRVYGIDKDLLVIEVYKGHGFLRLENAEGLYGGTITIGMNTYPIEEGAVYAMREGSYQVLLEKEGEASAAEVVIEKNTTVVIDAAQYGGKIPDKGVVWFSIEPFGAKLYIDGVDTYYYETEVELEYGTYPIEVNLGGYTSCIGTIKVDKPYQNYKFELVENPTDETDSGDLGDGENTDEDSSYDENDEGTEDEFGNTEPGSETMDETVDEQENVDDRTNVSVVGRLNYVLDEANKTAITKPVGAKVYIDDVYIGTVPVEFEKILDPFVLILKNGDREKSYAITPDDNDEDAVYSFPDI